MRIIDAHAHLLDLPNYVDQLINTMDENSIDKCCISGLGKLFNCVDNEGVSKAIDKYPDRLIGSYFIRPGINTNKDIKIAHDEGFRLIKDTIPTKPYDDLEYYPLWETIQEYNLPVLFHTGVITIPNTFHNQQISSWSMHPMRVEQIANSFPDLKIIIAHLGVHWNDDAVELLRMRSNVFADLTGEPDGWRVRVDAIGIKHWLWWPNAFKKIIFGTDVHYEKIPLILNQDNARLDRYNIDQETRELIFSKNILTLMEGK